MKPRQFLNAPRTTTTTLVILGLVILLGYSLFVLTPYLEGPSLTISEPSGHTEQSPVTIAGKTERVSFLEINGMQIPVNEDGTFQAVRAYPEGYTEVIVTVRDRFGRERTERLSFITNHDYPLHAYGNKEEN